MLKNLEETAIGGLSAAQFSKAARVLVKKLKDTEGLKEELKELGKAAREIGQLALKLQLQKPCDIVFVRHGRSEANQLKTIEEAGKMTESLRAALSSTPDNRWRLIPSGVLDAKAAGKWLKANLGWKFDAAYVSDFVRARETAGNLGQEFDSSIEWRTNPFFGERSWSKFDSLAPDVQRSEMTARISNPRHWVAPVPGAESFRNLEGQVRMGLDILFKNHSREKVLVVGHGEQIVAAISIIQKLPECEISRLLKDGIPNGGIVHFSRCNPETGKFSKTFRWVRLIDPQNREKYSERWNAKWQKFSRPVYSSKELVQEVAGFARVIPDELCNIKGI